jgi:hypothetical protein
LHAFAEIETSQNESDADVIKVELGDIVHAPGYWIDGLALHDLHQAYKIERDKRAACESAVDLLAHIEKVYDAAQMATDNGVSWAWWITWGATTFTAGVVVGLSLK